MTPIILLLVIPFTVAAYIVGRRHGLDLERNRRSDWLRYLESRLNPPQLKSEKTWFEAMERVFNGIESRERFKALASKDAKNIKNAAVRQREAFEDAVASGDEVAQRRYLPRVDPHTISSARGPTLMMAHVLANHATWRNSHG